MLTMKCSWDKERWYCADNDDVHGIMSAGIVLTMLVNVHGIKSMKCSGIVLT